MTDEPVNGADLFRGYVAIGEAAQIIERSTSTVRRHDAELGAVRVGGRRLYPRARVEDFARKRAEAGR